MQGGGGRWSPMQGGGGRWSPMNVAASVITIETQDGGTGEHSSPEVGS